MPEEKKKEKKDYLKTAKNIYESTATYDSPVDRGEIQAAQTLATIAIAEELRRLNNQAAAPDMLDVLEAIISACDEPTPHIPKIKHIVENAIAKVKGE